MAIYGKLAEGPHGGILPHTACVWYAAAINAGVRAKLLRATAGARNHIVEYATDGITSTVRLAIDCPTEKTLGTWEKGELARAWFVQSGVSWKETSLRGKLSSRGFRPAFMNARNPDGTQKTLEQWIKRDVPEAIKHGETSLEYQYINYLSFGAALASKELWRLAGSWVETTRTHDLMSAGAKRAPLATKAHAKRLVDTQVAIARGKNFFVFESQMHRGGWLARNPVAQFDKEAEEMPIEKSGIFK